MRCAVPLPLGVSTRAAGSGEQGHGSDQNYTWDLCSKCTLEKEVEWSVVA